MAPSFGDIFSANAVNNGLLPAAVEEAEAERLLLWLAAGGRELTVDLELGMVEADGISARFAVDPVFRTKLLNGWDDLDLTASYGAEIARFAETDRDQRPWVLPRGP